MAEEVGTGQRRQCRHVRRDLHLGQHLAGGERLTGFEEATALASRGPDRFAWTVPDGWQQGRGAWGGLIVGALVKAVEAAETDPARRIRSVTAHIMAPALVGPHAIAVEPLRIGSAVSTWRATLTAADGAPIAELVAVAGARRAFADSVPGSWGVSVPPAAPTPDEVPRVPGGPPFPVFTRHLDMRPVSGLPLSGGPAESIGWVGYDVATVPSAAALLALVDGWYPASLPLLATLPPIGTVSFTAALLADPESIRPDEVVLNHSFLTSASDGYTSEHRRLWSADGILLVDNVQTIVVGS